MKKVVFFIALLLLVQTLKAQIVKLPFVEKVDNSIDYFRILQIEKTKTAFRVVFLVEYTGQGVLRKEIGAANTTNEMVIIDIASGKKYKSLLRSTKNINAKGFINNVGYIATTFKIEFQAIPASVSIIDIIQGDCKRDALCFMGIHLDDNLTRDNQINIALFNEWTHGELNKHVLPTLQLNNQNPNIRTLPNGWQYEIIKKGNGKFINLSEFENYKHSFGKVKLFSRWHDYTYQNGKGEYIPKEETEEYELGLKNSITALRGHRYSMEEALLLMDEGAVWKVYIPGYHNSGNRRYTGVYDYYVAEITIDRHVFNNVANTVSNNMANANAGSAKKPVNQNAFNVNENYKYSIGCKTYFDFDINRPSSEGFIGGVFFKNKYIVRFNAEIIGREKENNIEYYKLKILSFEVGYQNRWATINEIKGLDKFEKEISDKYSQQIGKISGLKPLSELENDGMKSDCN